MIGFQPLGKTIIVARNDARDTYEVKGLVMDENGNVISGYGPQKKGAPHGDNGTIFFELNRGETTLARERQK